MTNARDQARDTEQRLARVEALEQMLDEMQVTLTTYREVLCKKLSVLQNATEPASAAPPAAVEEPPPPRKAPSGVLAPVSIKERRSWPRRRGNPVPVLLTNATVSIDPFQGWVLDRSQGGLRILVDQNVAAGTILNVRPTKAHGSFPWIQVKVRSCHPERSSWSLGVQFVNKPAWGELQAFG